MVWAGLQRPLAGVKIVALEQAVALPYCSFLLAELGAEVIKIERPVVGDVVRGWDDAVRGLSTGYVWVNAGKQSVELDLAQPTARKALRELVRQADVFAENLGPGAAARLGLGEADLADQPQLIFLSLSGFGQDGPYKGMKAYDLIMQAESGILLTNGSPEEPAKVGLPITDLIAGSNAAIGILTALFQRASTGQGARLDVAMLDSALPWLGYYPHHAWHSGAEPPRAGPRHQYIVPYGPYLAADGRDVCIVVADDRTWRAFCEQVIARPDWVTDPVMATIASRRAHRDQAEAAVEAIIAGQASEYWIERLAAAGIPYGRVNRMTDVIRHPQALARQMFVEADSPVGPVPLVRFPLAPPERVRRLPALGEHTAEILARVGYAVAGDGAVVGKDTQ